jgi:hypothetical protein
MPGGSARQVPRSTRSCQVVTNLRTRSPFNLMLKGCSASHTELSISDMLTLTDREQDSPSSQHLVLFHRVGLFGMQRSLKIGRCKVNQHRSKLDVKGGHVVSGRQERFEGRTMSPTFQHPLKSSLRFRRSRGYFVKQGRPPQMKIGRLRPTVNPDAIRFLELCRGNLNRHRLAG